MKKVRLELDALSVESFDTVARDGAADGTVFGQATYQAYCSYGYTCPETECADDCGTYATDCGSCATCEGTCAATCDDPSCCPTQCGTCDPYCCCTCSCY
jgi:hypothetical protein